MIIRMRLRMHPYHSKRYNYTPGELAGQFTLTCESFDEYKKFSQLFMMMIDSDCTMYDTYEIVDYILPNRHYSHEYVTQFNHHEALSYE